MLIVVQIEIFLVWVLEDRAIQRKNAFLFSKQVCWHSEQCSRLTEDVEVLSPPGGSDKRRRRTNLVAGLYRYI